MLRLVFILAIISLSLSGLVCSDSPTRSTPTEAYTLLFGDANTGWFYEYSMQSGIVDSFLLSYRATQSFLVSPDGQRLYFRSFDSVVVLNLGTHQAENVLHLPPSGTSLALSPDGTLLAVAGDSLTMIRTADWQIIYQESTSVCLPVFSRDGTLLYGSFAQYEPNFFTLDLNDSFKVTAETLPGGIIGQILPLFTPGHVALYTIPPYPYSYFSRTFAECDLNSKALIFSSNFKPGGGMIAMMANGRYVFYSNPGMLVPEMEHPGTPQAALFVYDPQSGQVVKEIPTIRAVNDSTVDSLFPTAIACTPDNKWTVATDLTGGNFVVVDNTTLEISRWGRIPHGQLVWDVLVRRVR